MAKSNQIQSVLVCVDHSKYSSTVVKQARKLALKLRAPLTFLHVFEIPSAHSWRLDVAKNKLFEFHLEQISRNYGLRGNEKREVRLGRPFEEILKVAKGMKSPLIVLGHRGQHKLISPMFLGSTAERVALNTTFPLWICRGNKDVAPKRILVPTDLSPHTAKVVERTKKLGFEGVRFEYFHVMLPLTPLLDYTQWQVANAEWTKVNELELEKFRRKSGKIKVVSKRDVDVAEAVNRQSRGFDAIAISPHTYRFTGFGSIVSKLIRSSQVPVLVLNL